ncbi:hypothetical protein, partial [Aeromonas hydrophila]|uniref:hypothetical protein n=1 Tax=Aeromonas hydrophila TaxID=644 RepID=UPI001CC48DE2
SKEQVAEVLKQAVAMQQDNQQRQQEQDLARKLEAEILLLLPLLIVLLHRHGLLENLRHLLLGQPLKRLLKR